MVFSSLLFLYFFLPLCILLYGLTPSLRGKNTVLLIFSLFFYAWGEPIWVIQMVLSGFVVYLAGLGMNHYAARRKKERLCLIIGVVAAILPLIIFKYAGFLIQNLNAVSGLTLPLPNLRMPIGISFYTFQVITYAVDVYRREANVQFSFADFLLYESFFPQLVAGPIVRYRDVDMQIRKRETSVAQFASGVERFLIGLGKKVLIANYAGTIVAQTLAEGRLARISGLEALIGLVAYSFQIYFDFSGYSDMAIGLGRFFGFEFMENFNYPYAANSVTDFWRRWHISLSTFFRDYVYIPLGGNRRHQSLNLLVVWFLTGLWHGASWNFIFWGLYFLIFLLIEKAFLLKILNKLPRAVASLYLLPVVCLGWALFYFTNLGELVQFLKILFTGPFISLEATILLRQNLIFFAIATLAALPIFAQLKKLKLPQSMRNWRSDWRGLTAAILFVVLMLALSTASLVADSFNPFLYYRF